MKKIELQGNCYRPNLYWTPCEAHFHDLMLQDIRKLEPVKNALKKIIFMNGYIYCRVPLVNMMRRFTNQHNPHPPAVTRFPTSFITMSQFHIKQSNLKKMVTSDDWNKSKWPREAGAKKLKHYILQALEECKLCTQADCPLVKGLRMVDGEKKPAMGYIYAAMDKANNSSFKIWWMLAMHSSCLVPWLRCLGWWMEKRNQLWDTYMLLWTELKRLLEGVSR